MRLLCFFFISCFRLCNTYIVPKSLIGTWMPVNSCAVFHLSRDNVQTFYNNGDLKMNIYNVSMNNNSSIHLFLNELQINKIPSDIDFKSMLRAISILKNIFRHDLEIIFQNDTFIHYKSGKLNGCVAIKKIDTNK